MLGNGGGYRETVGVLRRKVPNNDEEALMGKGVCVNELGDPTPASHNPSHDVLLLPLPIDATFPPIGTQTLGHSTLSVVY